MNTIRIRHNFESAHRLPHLGGKCQSLHGHSWWAEVTLAGPVDRSGILVDFGQVKADLRTWIDLHLDHGAMLGAGDPLLPHLEAEGSKVFRFGAQSGTDSQDLARDLHWPTVENVAVLIARYASIVLANGDAVDIERPVRAERLHVACVRVQETHANSAEWRR